MKPVSERLGVSRSQLTARLKQGSHPKVRRSRSLDDAALVAETHKYLGDLPTYGYRRMWGLLRRSREQLALPAVNMKRVCRVMRDISYCWLVERDSQPVIMRVESLLQPATPADVLMVLSSAAMTVPS